MHAPIAYAINVIKICLLFDGFFIKTGIKNACMANAKLIVAPKVYKFVPIGFQFVDPYYFGAVLITQIRKIK
jgi:hypothetical protein